MRPKQKGLCLWRLRHQGKECGPHPEPDSRPAVQSINVGSCELVPGRQHFLREGMVLEQSQQVWAIAIFSPVLRVD